MKESKESGGREEKEMKKGGERGVRKGKQKEQIRKKNVQRKSLNHNSFR